MRGRDGHRATTYSVDDNDNDRDLDQQRNSIAHVDLSNVDAATLREVARQQAYVIQKLQQRQQQSRSRSRSRSRSPRRHRHQQQQQRRSSQSTEIALPVRGSTALPVSAVHIPTAFTEEDVPMAQELAVAVAKVDPAAAKQAEKDAGDACAMIIFGLGFIVFPVWYANLLMLCKETTKRGQVSQKTACLDLHQR